VLHSRDHPGLTEEKKVLLILVAFQIPKLSLVSMQGEKVRFAEEASIYLASSLTSTVPTHIGHSWQLQPQILVLIQQERFFNTAQ